MEDISNQQFNALTAVSPIFKYRREWVWLCNCQCGKQTNVRISKLRNNHTKSCGCVRVTPPAKYGPQNRDWQGFGEISMTFYNRMRRTANLRKLTWNISIEYLWELFIKQDRKCIYSGHKLIMPINVRQLRGEGNETIASLDRINNDAGYIEGNVQWVAKRVNYMKHTMTDKYFLSYIKMIYEHQKL